MLVRLKSRFRHRTFHEPKIIHWIKYMKISASESIRNACFNLNSPLVRLRHCFDSDTELFMYRTICINYYNLFYKQFDRNEHFSPFELSSSVTKNGVWINSSGLNLGPPSFELCSAHEKFGVWTGPNMTFEIVKQTTSSSFWQKVRTRGWYSKLGVYILYNFIMQVKA